MSWIQRDRTSSQVGKLEHPTYRTFPARTRIFYASVTGVTKENPDGSSRQEIPKECSVGEKVSLVIDSNRYMVVTESGEQIGWLKSNAENELATELGKGRIITAKIYELPGGTVFDKTKRCNLKIISKASLPEVKA